MTAAVLFGAFVVGTLSAEQPGGRITLPFGFGWRVRLGEPDAAAPACAGVFSPLDGLRCPGLTPYDAAVTPVDCHAVCCSDPACSTFLYSDRPVPPGPGHDLNETSHCFIGSPTATSASTPCQPAPGWTGGMRAMPAPRPGPRSIAPARSDYNRSDWGLVDAPHDFRITLPYATDEGRGQAYLPFRVAWYTKQFTLPTEWAGRTSYLVFRGTMRSARVYLDGVEVAFHPLAYAEFAVALPPARVRPGATATVAVFIDMTYSAFDGSGWWYEGGGLTRGVDLVSFPAAVHVALEGGVFPVSSLPPNATIKMATPGDGSAGLVADAVQVAVQVTLANGGPDDATVEVDIEVTDPATGAVVGKTSQTGVVVLASTSSVATVANLAIAGAKLWSIPRPHLYSLSVTVSTVTSAGGRRVIDAVTMPLGLRTAEWDPATGMRLNRQRVRFKGFCLHDDFAGVGVAVPDRINLFRAQSLRGIGANAWRFSHNPGSRATLNLLDTLGVMVWQENRQFDTDPSHVSGMAEMVLQSRHHPAVMIYSMCNEAHCKYYDASGPGNGLNRDRPIDQIAAGESYMATAHRLDPSRPTSGNMIEFGPETLSEVLDVQGFSHGGGLQAVAYRKAGNTKPVINSECCSCRTIRGTQNNGTDSSGSGQFADWSNFNAECMAAQTNVSLSNRMVAGSFVWTLFDYYGEPSKGGFPELSSSFGVFDLAGAAKAGASWFKAWWLDIEDAYLAGDNAQSDRPPLPNRTTVHLLNDMQPPPEWILAAGGEGGGEGKARFVKVIAYSSAPAVELLHNGRSVGISKVPRLGYAEWDVPWAPGNLTAVVVPGPSMPGASHTVVTAGAPAALRLVTTVPSLATGTGTALVADGLDAGLVSAELVDAAGNFVPSSGANITFVVVKGPGRLIGVGNGDPKCAEPNQVPWRSSFRGRAAVVVQTDRWCSGPDWRRKLVRKIDAQGGSRTAVCTTTAARGSALGSITVMASSPGLTSATADIQVSTEPEADGVLAVAARSIQAANMP